jgi:hypothetical protein
MAELITLSGEDNVRLVLALSRAQLIPFDRGDWQSWSGAMGSTPHTIIFHKRDDEYLRKALGITHWATDYHTIILDDGGITWNGCSPVNSYAYAVTVALDVDNYDVGEDNYWEVSDRGYGAVDQRIAALPPEVRATVMACPEEARVHVLDGMDRMRAELAEKKAAEAAKLRWWIRHDVRTDRFNVWVEQPGGSKLASVPYTHTESMRASAWARRTLSNTLYREANPDHMLGEWHLTGEVGAGVFQMPVGSTVVRVEPAGLSQAPEAAKLLNRMAWMVHVGSNQHEVYVQAPDGTIPADPGYRGSEGGCIGYLQSQHGMLTVVRGNPPEATTQRQIAAAKAMDPAHA